ncbi:MAG: glycine/sarcosine/betaine reductase complex component C subunit beta [Pseudomonadota bacterium]
MNVRATPVETNPVITASSYILAHVPNMVRYGSKPIREIQDQGDGFWEKARRRLRDFEASVAYPPNQAFIGNLSPEDLWEIPRPWYENPVPSAERWGSFGEIMPELEFLGLLKWVDQFHLISLSPWAAASSREALAKHPLLGSLDLSPIGQGVEEDKLLKKVQSEQALPLFLGERLAGAVRRDHDRDESLTASVLLENLSVKATGVLAARHLFKNRGLKPAEVDFILSCSEEAVGDRYNRGGGGMAKAIGETVRCVNSTGCDIKAFCAGSQYAILHAAALVKSGVFSRVMVVAGGSFAKLGMKFMGHLKAGVPILEDVLGGLGFMIEPDDQKSPVIRMDSVGKHDIGAASSNQAIMESLVVKPLERLGLGITEVDRYSVELHNPEITEPAGSGNVPRTNYRLIGAIAAIRGEIERTQVEEFERKYGLPGFSPTQGHIPASVPYIGHALKGIRKGKLRRVMFVAKGSLFLGRMTQLSDGISYIVERNPALNAG